MAKKCEAGSRHAIVAGRHECLRAGRRCTARYDRQYHRYGFHCHSGTLRRAAAPPPQQRKPACSDGIDNDYDYAVDYPADQGCSSAEDDDER